MARALRDCLSLHAFNAEYIANVLEQREHILPEPGALHLTRAQDLLELDLPEPDLSTYEPKTQLKMPLPGSEPTSSSAAERQTGNPEKPTNTRSTEDDNEDQNQSED